MTMTRCAWMTVTGALCAISARAAAPAPPATDSIAGPAAGPWRRLFLDAMAVEQHQGLERVFHAADKYANNPVIRKDRPWEGTGSYTGPYLYGTVMWDQGKLRMWYHVHESGYMTCYAESRDGLSWTKPNLGLFEYRGSRDNNLIAMFAADAGPEPAYESMGKCHNANVIRQPWEPDPAKRYAFFCYDISCRWTRVAYSPDGLSWTLTAATREKPLYRGGDVNNFFYDPYNRRYVATLKSGTRRGRAADVAVSKDGLAWTKLVQGLSAPVFGADDLDPDATQVYGMPVFPYQGLFIGLPWVYNARWFKYGSYTDQRMYDVEKDSPCTMDVQLAWSWDLVNWTRPFPRRQFIPRGAAGTFDSDMIYTARAPVQVGDRLHFYYGGWDGPHNNPKATSNIGLAILRLDGFCSMHAGNAEGWLITRREPLQRPRITINAKTAANGYVAAELLDRDSNVVEGFSREQCTPFNGDSVSHTLTWRTAEFTTSQQDGDLKIRFYLKDADLYSYLPE